MNLFSPRLKRHFSSQIAIGHLLMIVGRICSYKMTFSISVLFLFLHGTHLLNCMTSFSLLTDNHRSSSCENLFSYCCIVSVLQWYSPARLLYTCCLENEDVVISEIKFVCCLNWSSCRHTFIKVFQQFFRRIKIYTSTNLHQSYLNRIDVKNAPVIRVRQ